MLRLMLVGRALDEAETRLRRQGRTFFQLSCTGHEAVQAAAAMLLRPGRDWFYPYYRDRVLCLGLGVRPADMLLQSMGKSTDPSSGGREMPCHFGSAPLHIVTQSSPTGSQYLNAVGTAEAGVLAKAARDRAAAAVRGDGAAASAALDLIPPSEDDELVYVSGGDGSTSQGEFFEALSLASIRRLPVLFLIQDNGYAISVPVEEQSPGGRISTVARGFPHFLVEEVDGLDAIESYRALKRAVGYVRARQGPAFVHARVVRICPHSDSDDDRTYKTALERAEDQRRDPLKAFQALLYREGYLARKELEALVEDVRAEIASAIQEASAAPNPEPESATRYVWAAAAPRKSPEPRGRVPEPSGGEAGAPVTMVEAINRTLAIEMERDPRIICFGEDVADLSRSHLLEALSGKGGVFRVTHKLQRRFGDHRVFNTPVAEAGIVGRAVGLAVRGFRPVAEIQFFDYIWPAMQQIRSEVAMLRWRSNNAFSCPVVLRVATGGYVSGGGPYHSQSGESVFCHFPGLVVVMPSNARDAAGLLRSALRSEDPVLFLEHKHLYRKHCARAPYPGPQYVVPFGVAATAREGSDVTVVTFGAIVEKSLQAADLLEAEGLSVEVIDLRSLQPYDWESIARSVKKTNRAVVAYEDNRTHGFGAEIAARIAEELFEDLDAPVVRVAALDAPIGYSPAIEQAVLPKVRDVADGIRRVCAY